MREDGGDCEAAWALHVHEVGVGALHETLELVAPLLALREGVKQVDGESHIFLLDQRMNAINLAFFEF